MTWALPLALMALDELESTKSPPGRFTFAFPEAVTAPLAVGLRMCALPEARLLVSLKFAGVVMPLAVAATV